MKQPWIDHVHNRLYFNFVERAAQKGVDTALPVDRATALSYVQIVLRMVREEYEDGGEEQLKKILNIDGGGYGSEADEKITEAGQKRATKGPGGASEVAERLAFF